jgi:hypothetical protein
MFIKDGYSQWRIYMAALKTLTDSAKFEECILLLIINKNGFNLKKLCFRI